MAITDKSKKRQEMTKKYQVFMVVFAVLLASATYFLVSSQSVRPDPVVQKASTPENTQESNTDKELAVGRYIDYDEAVLSDDKYSTTILFFHAPWCVECRGFDAQLTGEPIPSGVQVLKVDYDTRQDLRQKYDVTIQTTFVRVDVNGEKQAKWVGYGKDKSVTAIIENTR